MTRLILVVTLLTLIGCTSAPRSGDPIQNAESACINLAIERGGSLTDCLDFSDRLRARRARRAASSQSQAAANRPSITETLGSEIFAKSNESGKLVFVNIKGLIGDGDSNRLKQLIHDLPTRYPDANDSVYVLNSPGGSLLEAKIISAGVAASTLPVAVFPHEECSSACFLILAAAKTKYVSRSARIGVHSVVDGVSGNETTGAKAVTTEFARACAEFGVPDQIIGRMVTTPPGQVAWLSQDELASMGVHLLPAEYDK